MHVYQIKLNSSRSARLGSQPRSLHVHVDISSIFRYIFHMSSMYLLAGVTVREDLVLYFGMCFYFAADALSAGRARNEQSGRVVKQ